MNEAVLLDNRLCGKVGACVTPQVMVRLGMAMGGVSPKNAVAVGHSAHPEARALAAAFWSGVVFGGAYLTDFGPVFRTMFDFSMRYTAAELGVYIDTCTEDAEITVLGLGALPPSVAVSEELERLFTEEAPTLKESGFGERLPLEGMQVLYGSELLRHAPFGLSGLSAQVLCNEARVQRLLQSTLEALGCQRGSELRLRVSPCGRTLQIEEGDCVLSLEQTLCLGALLRFFEGEDVALDYMAPRAVDILAKRFGRRVLRYSGFGGGEEEALCLASTQPELRDALMLSVHLFSYLCRSGCTLLSLLEELPTFGTCKRVLPLSQGRERLLQKAQAEGGRIFSQGAVLPRGAGQVSFCVSRHQNIINIFAEAQNVELSEELCGGFISEFLEGK